MQIRQVKCVGGGARGLGVAFLFTLRFGYHGSARLLYGLRGGRVCRFAAAVALANAAALSALRRAAAACERVTRRSGVEAVEDSPLLTVEAGPI